MYCTNTNTCLYNVLCTGDVANVGPKKLMNTVESITSAKPKNVESSYVVRTALTLNNYPVELLEDRDIQIASELAKKFMAFSLQGQVDEADITVNHIQGQVRRHAFSQGVEGAA